MKDTLKTIGEIIGIGVILFGLHKGNVIGLETAITIGIIVVIILICFQQFHEEMGQLRQEFKEEMRIELKPILDKLSKHDIDLAVIKKDMYGYSGSPMHPNERGEKLLTDSKFYEIYPKIKDKVFAILDREKTRTLYDAEKNSESALAELSKDPLFDDMKNYSVNNPKESLDFIFGIAAWVIRDDYAKAREIKK